MQSSKVVLGCAMYWNAMTCILEAVCTVMAVTSIISRTAVLMAAKKHLWLIGSTEQDRQAHDPRVMSI